VFYFEQLLQTALNGIDAANVTSAVLGVAGTILLLSFLYSAYEAFAAGGDVRMLASSGTKYLVLGLVFANYGAAFRDVNGMFNSVANFIYNSTGVGDLFANWMNQLAQYWQANGSTSLWNLVTGLASGVISLMLILSAFVIFPICYLVFTVFYAMYGSVLYVTGPFVLALLPTRGLGQLSRTYLVNLMIFQAWGFDLRDHSSPHVGGESVEHKRCARRQRSSEQFRRFERNDTSGAYSQYFFFLDCVDPVHRQPHRSG